jgi:uncharacterized protein YprB with RNaseH-like and TPR domain
VIVYYTIAMLSFDIETEGLDSDEDDITVASVYDPERGIKKTFFFQREGYDRKENIDEFLGVLDDAPSLCCFNGVRFDIPFIIKVFGVEHDRYFFWFLKLFDYFEVCKLVFASSCGLNTMLAANGEDVKNSCGLQAVYWARDKEWEMLDEYCMRDTVLTHVLSSRVRVEIPLTGKRRVCVMSSGLGNDRKFLFHY